MDEHEDQTQNTDNPVPPTIRLTPAGGKPGPSAAPKIKLHAAPAAVPPAHVIPPPTVTAPTGVNAKKETARVNLPPIADRRPDTVTVPPIAPMLHPDTESPAQDSGVAPIRIKRPVTTSLRPPTTLEAKKETSRVDIQTAMAETEQAPSAPKTIRLKRPGTTIIEQAPQSMPKTATLPQIDDAKKSETSRIELPAEASVEIPQRRKTVQIKRAHGGAAPRLVTAGRTESGSDSQEEAFITINAEDESTIVFSLVSLAAAIVTCVLLYVLAAQTVFPSLPWPGKL